MTLNRKVKEMQLTEPSFERRRFKRHGVKKKPIAVLGPDPVRVGHVTVVSDQAAEIQFSETNDRAAAKFSELVILISECNSAFLSEKIYVDTISCCSTRVNGSGLQSRMRKCVVSLNNLDTDSRQQIKSACLLSAK